MEDSHRMFLQSIMSGGVMNGKEVKEYHKLACERCEDVYTGSGEELVQFVGTINTNIKPYGLEIKKSVDEFSGKHSFVFVNKAENSITSLHPEYSVNEMELFKKLVASLVDSSTGTISSTVALRLGSGLETKMSQNDTDKFYKQLRLNKWIVLTTDGHYALSTRSLADLEVYIKDQFDAVQCSLCHKLCLSGQNCPNCEVRVHFHCAAKYFKDQRKTVCLSDVCSAPWPEKELPPTVSND